MNARYAVMAAFALASVAFAQNDTPFQARYASNLNIGDSVINLTNMGAAAPTNLCANVYTFAPDEQLVSCCSCQITPNALVSLSVRNDLTSNTLTPAVESSVVVKILATTGGPCNAAAPGTPTLGLAAFGTTIHALPTSPVTYGVTETEFARGTLSANELARISSFCGFIQANGSGFGICRSCRLGGLGADKQ